MIVGVPREIYPGERRVALAPTAIPTLAKAEMEVVIERVPARVPVTPTQSTSPKERELSPIA
jgi:alanine dehydrogenase